MMDLALSFEQAEFCSSTRRLVDSIVLRPEGTDAQGYAAAWTQFAETGVAGLCLSPAVGGFSGEPEDVALVAAELGRAPGATPRIETMVLAAGLLANAGGTLGAGLREQFVAGKSQPAVAWFEGGDAFGGGEAATRARYGPDGIVLQGRKLAVIGGPTADCLLVCATLASGEPALFAVGPDAPGVAVYAYRLFDTTPVADIEFDGAPVLTGEPLLCGDHAAIAMGEAFDRALLAQCAAQIGAMDRAITLSIEFLKTRRQFGKALAEFQVLQHRVADMFITANDARSSLYAAIAASRLDPVARTAAASRCKVKVTETAMSVIGDAVHLHGGIGTTAEYAVGHLYRRAVVDNLIFGNGDYHLARLMGKQAAHPTAWRQPVPIFG